MKKISEMFCFFLLIISFLNYTGCYSSKVVSQDIFYSENSTESIGDITIITNEDDIIEIGEDTYQVICDTLFARGLLKTNVTVYNQPIHVKIALEDIKHIEIDEQDGLKTAGCLIGVGALVFVVVIGVAVANSGPWFQWSDN